MSDSRKWNKIVGCIMASFMDSATKTELIDFVRGAEQSPSKWIPVTERLPEYDGTYLAFTTSGTVTTARWYAEHDMRNYRGDFIRHMEGRFHRNVTHWMPLPEPPEEE